MPSGVPLQDLVDFAAQTLAHYVERPKFIDLVSGLQDYFIRRLFDSDRVMVRGGKRVEQPVLLYPDGSFRMTAPYAQDVVAVEKHFEMLFQNWRHSTMNYAFDHLEEEFQGADSVEKISDIIMGREAAVIAGEHDGMEEQGWEAPPDANDTEHQYGIKYYVVKSATTPAGGFTGGAPSGHTLVSGLDPSTSSKLRNWSANYQQITASDFGRKLTNACRYTKWKSPVNLAQVTKKESNRVFVTNGAVLNALEELQESRNDNLAGEIIPFYDSVVVKRTPVEMAYYLDNDAENPFYGLDLNWWKLFVQSNEWMTRTTDRAPNQHTTHRVFIDVSWLPFCQKRNAQFVLYKPAA